MVTIKKISIEEFFKGNPGVQNYYKLGRQIKTINLNEVDSYCACGYIMLKPKNRFEQYHGGLTVKRSKVKIYKEDGTLVKRLRIERTWSCNACANGWK